MSNRHARAPGHRWRTFSLFGAAALAGVVVALWRWPGVFDERRLEPAPALTPVPAAVESTPASLDSHDAPRPAPAAALELPYDGRLRPSDVLGKLDCRLARGRGAAAGAAVVALPHGQGARFSVLDREGAIFGDELPFRPNHMQIGQREDGTTLVGLGDLRRNSKPPRPPDSLEPVYIFLGGQLIYQSDKVWDFRVARDASSFAIHEPSGAGGGRLVVRNLQLDEEQHFDLGTRMTPTEDVDRQTVPEQGIEGRRVAARPSHTTMDYTPDGAQIMFEERQPGPWGDVAYWLYPAVGDLRKVIRVQDYFGSLLASSREGYFASMGNERGVWRITKNRIDTRAGTIEPAWASDLDLTSFRGRLSVSDDGRWLGVHGRRNFQVLDTETGRAAFLYPKFGDPQRQMAMLANVLGENPSPADVGRLDNIAFRDGTMWFFRSFGSHGCPPRDKIDDVRYRECVNAHREHGRYKTVADVYDLDTLAPDSQPMFRVEIFEETDCMEADARLPGLRDVAGELAYRTKDPSY